MSAWGAKVVFRVRLASQYPIKVDAKSNFAIQDEREIQGSKYIWDPTGIVLGFKIRHQCTKTTRNALVYVMHVTFFGPVFFTSGASCCF